VETEEWQRRLDGAKGFRWNKKEMRAGINKDIKRFYSVFVKRCEKYSYPRVTE
jgi:hypothetical protein